MEKLVLAQYFSSGNKWREVINGYESVENNQLYF
jgi:hypothetical protein